METVLKAELLSRLTESLLPIPMVLPELSMAPVTPSSRVTVALLTPKELFCPEIMYVSPVPESVTMELLPDIIRVLGALSFMVTVSSSTTVIVLPLPVKMAVSLSCSVMVESLELIVFLPKLPPLYSRVTRGESRNAGGN
jgi:hypothetical protein